MEDVNTVAQTWTAELYFEFVFAVAKPGVKRGLPAAAKGAASQSLLAEIQTLVNTGASWGRDKLLEVRFKDFFWPNVSFSRTEEDDEVWVSGNVKYELRAAIAREESISEADYNFVSFSLRTVRTFSQSFRLRLFPFDHQLLMARIVLQQGRDRFRFALRDENYKAWPKLKSSGGGGGPPQEVHCTNEVSINAVNGAYSPMMGEWRLRKQTCSRACVSDKMASRSETQYPVLKVLILAKRRSGYHFWLLIAPLLLILLLCFFVLRSGMDDSNRYQAISAMLFTAIQIKAQVAALLPRLHSMTVLDRFTIQVIFCVFLTAVQTFLTDGSCRAPNHDENEFLGIPTRFALCSAVYVSIAWGFVLAMIQYVPFLKLLPFDVATKNVFTRKDKNKKEPRSCYRFWKRSVKDHPNVPDNQDRDELIDDAWPREKDFGRIVKPSEMR
jgi:hypothetical protein